MTSFFAMRALLFAAECLGGSLLLLGGAAVATRFARSAALRHFVWLTAFGAMLMLPVAALIVPPQIVVHRAADTAQTTPLPTAETDATTPAVVVAAPVVTPAPKPAGTLSLRDVAMALFGLWSLGFLWAAMRLFFGAIGVNALHMSSSRIASEDLDPDCAGCELRLASEDSGPMTWGFVKPVILLPAEATHWSAERRRAVLLHELAHVRRRDSLAQILSLIACALYWPNPLAWIGARAMRRDAEIAADDSVIDAGVKPSAYARELLQLAEQYRGLRRAAVAGVSMASPSALKQRVESVLTPNRSRRGMTTMDIAKIAGAGLLATAALAFARPSLAQDAPPVPPAPPAVTTADVAPLPPAPPAVTTADLPPLPPASPTVATADVPPLPAPDRMAQNDMPPPPPPPPPAPPPPAPDAPPAPPAPPAADMPPPPPPPPPPGADADMGGQDADVDIVTSKDGHRHEYHRHYHHMTPEEREEVRQAVGNARQEVHDAMAKARPQIEHAMAELKAHQAEFEKIRPQIERAMREERPQIEKAMAEARAELAKAHLDAKLQAHLDRALQKAELRIEAHERDGMHRERIIEEHDDHDGNREVRESDHDAGGAHVEERDTDHDSDNDQDDNDNDSDNGNSPH
jgi:beta-lactamase regulating signal transducer with metallopeptidase domain/vacuolar-type H+-ATPase subunit E/Vma4